jgi:hypothetical protein
MYNTGNLASVLRNQTLVGMINHINAVINKRDLTTLRNIRPIVSSTDIAAFKQFALRKFNELHNKCSGTEEIIQEIVNSYIQQKLLQYCHETLKLGDQEQPEFPNHVRGSTAFMIKGSQCAQSISEVDEGGEGWLNTGWNPPNIPDEFVFVVYELHISSSSRNIQLWTSPSKFELELHYPGTGTYHGYCYVIAPIIKSIWKYVITCGRVPNLSTISSNEPWIYMKINELPSLEHNTRPLNQDRVKLYFDPAYMASLLPTEPYIMLKPDQLISMQSEQHLTMKISFEFTNDHGIIINVPTDHFQVVAWTATNPTILTLAAPHGLNPGDIITFFDIVKNDQPWVFGYYPVNIVGLNQISIPLDGGTLPALPAHLYIIIEKYQFKLTLKLYSLQKK